MTIPRRPTASRRARLLVLAAVGVLAVAACSDDFSGTNASPVTDGGGGTVDTGATGGTGGAGTGTGGAGTGGSTTGGSSAGGSSAGGSSTDGSNTSDAGATVDAAALAGHTFLSTQVDGKDLVAGTQITLTFDESNVGANAGCNTMTGGYKVDGGKLVVTQLAQTRIACEPQFEAQDLWVGQLLSGSPKIALDEANMTLEGGGTTVTFADRVSLSPQNRLDDTSWLIESLETGGTTMQAPEGAEMSFSNGSVSVVTGCNNASGSADVQSELITFGPMVATLKACEPQLQQWQDALLGFLQGSVAFGTSGDNVVLGTQASRLTLTPLI
jgi:heat shock protein HslJ